MPSGTRTQWPKFSILACLVLGAPLLGSCQRPLPSPEQSPSVRRPRTSLLFPSSIDELPSTYAGPRFELSQAYPAERPPAEQFPWLEFDFKTQPDEYLLAVRDYCLEGNVEADWKVQNNRIRRWYHMPWMHTGRHPREGARGLTWELPSQPGKLGPAQTEAVQNWAVSVYNPPGGYLIGRVWRDAGSAPDLSETQFPVGTVSCKLLFTSATPDQVPTLRGSVEWDAHIHESADKSSPRVMGRVRLLQVDIAVRDGRADEATGWVFGTLVYSYDSPGADAWRRITPVGLMWGNDPGVLPGGALHETVVAHAAPAFARATLGWGGRMNGPVDNPESSCLSCHGVAQWRSLAPIVPSGLNHRRLHWFRNLRPDQPFCEGERSLDYSLQMAVAVRTYFTPEYNPGVTPPPAGTCIGLPEAPGILSVPTDSGPGFPFDRGE